MCFNCKGLWIDAGELAHFEKQLRSPETAPRGRERPAQHLQERLTMSLTLEEVRHVAGLARLSLSAEEEALMRTQLSAILDAVAELSQVDTSAVEPTSHAAGEVAPWRPDEVRPSSRPRRRWAMPRRRWGPASPSRASSSDVMEPTELSMLELGKKLASRRALQRGGGARLPGPGGPLRRPGEGLPESGP